MNRLIILTFALLLGLTVSAQNKGEVWRYDAGSGNWFQVNPVQPSEKQTEKTKGTESKQRKQHKRTNRPKTNVVKVDEKVSRLETTSQLSDTVRTYKKVLIPETNVAVVTNYKPWNVYGLVRTNLIGDALLVPNLGGEITVGKDWSLGADFYLQWIRNLDKDKFYKTYILDVDARYWWGRQHKKRQLTGWHVGPYGQAITYDMENGHKGYQSRVFFWTFAVGGELGYNLPLGKKQRWGLDFNIGLGYLHTKYNVYNPGHNKEYYFDHRQCRNFFGPTRIGVSLNYFIK